MKKKALALFLFALALTSITTIPEDKENALVLFALAVVFAFLGVRVWKGKRKGAPKSNKKGQSGSVAGKRPVTSKTSIIKPATPEASEAGLATPEAPEAKPSAPNASEYRFIEFKLKGVTFKNEDGTSRQELIRRIDEQEPPFENGGELSVDLKPVLFDGKDAIECRVNGYLVGHVPKELVPDVMDAMKAADATISGFKVIGGGEKENGEKLNYGIYMAVRFSPK